MPVNKGYSLKNGSTRARRACLSALLEDLEALSSGSAGDKRDRYERQGKPINQVDGVLQDYLDQLLISLTCCRPL